jgi:WASH complex subunit 7
MQIRSIALCLEMMKSIQSAYSRKREFIIESRKFVVSSAQRTIYDTFSRVEKEIPALLKSKRKDSLHLQTVLSAIDVVLRQLDYPYSKERFALIRTGAEFSLSETLFASEQSQDILFNLWKIETLQTIEECVDYICSTDFVFFISDMFPTMLNDILVNPENAARLYYLLEAFQDGLKVAKCAKHLQDSSIMSENYTSFIMKELKQNFIDTISKNIENDLRLHFHAVELNQENLNQSNYQQYTYILNLKPLLYFGEIIDIKQRVSHYLDVTFYNLATISLHKWKTYAEMRALARQKYGLELNEVYLPSHAHFSQGLDVLEIMRNIHVFVSRYNYNINSQVFIQRAIDQKHLNTIGIEHISNSIKTHGSGIMATTVNFAYQFLKKKFNVFSEFLFDDYILSRLIRDIRFFSEKRNEFKNEYPYEKAEKLINEIRSLGVSQKGMSYLDHFRQLITEIGNALGYVRMIRSGGLNALSNSIKFIPDLKSSLKFEELVRSENLSEQSINAAKIFDSHLNFLNDQFAGESDYFKILVRVISQVLSQSPNSSHLKNFFVIVPAVSITFVEKMLTQKERIGKRSGTEVSFTDDGFALGLAFILKILSQNDEFNTLHWFESVNSYVERKKAQLSRPESGNDSETIAISSKRLMSLKKEYELLFYSFSGSRIFFRDSDPVAMLSSSEPSSSVPEGE